MAHLPSPLLTLFSLLIFFLAVVLYTPAQSLSPFLSNLSPLVYPRGSHTSITRPSPYSGSWRTWFHPRRTRVESSTEHRHGWNLMYHLGGCGPWVEKVDGPPDVQGITPPEGCVVEQVHMVRSFFFPYPFVDLSLLKFYWITIYRQYKLYFQETADGSDGKYA